jgi:hypothetical protein
MKVKKGEVEEHKNNVCLEEIAPCIFAEYGCQSKVLRKNMEDHLAAQIGNHMYIMKKGTDDLISQIKQDFESQLRIRDDRIKQLEKAVKDLGTGNCNQNINFDADTKIEWRVKNWSATKKKSYLQSDKFTLGDFTWYG